MVSVTQAMRGKMSLSFLHVLLKCAVNEAHVVKCPWLAGCGERMVFQNCAVIQWPLLVFC